jgi:hypothetical protein
VRGWSAGNGALGVAIGGGVFCRPATLDLVGCRVVEEGEAARGATFFCIASILDWTHIPGDRGPEGGLGGGGGCGGWCIRMAALGMRQGGMWGCEEGGGQCKLLMERNSPIGRDDEPQVTSMGLQAAVVTLMYCLLHIPCLSHHLISTLSCKHPPLTMQAPEGEYAGPTSLAQVKQPETPYSKLLKELHDRCVCVESESVWRHRG